MCLIFQRLVCLFKFSVCFSVFFARSILKKSNTYKWIIWVNDLKLFPLPPQTGLYRLSGADRQVKELKEKFLRCKTVPVLSKVDDIHVITGVLKDFLRNLKEPLLTFSLNHPFMEAAGVSLYSGPLHSDALRTFSFRGS